MKLFKIPFLAAKEVLMPIQNYPIMYSGHYGYLDNLNIKIFPLYQKI